jgi:cell division protein FtsB
MVASVARMIPARRPKRRPAEKVSRAARRRSREARRRRFVLVGGAVLSLAILGAWFPANALYHQHANLASTEAQLRILHQQDAALAQEKKNLSNPTEIARIAREQYQLVSPGQQAFEVLPRTGSSEKSSPYSGDPALSGPVAPSSASVLPPGSATTTTTTSVATTTPTTSAAHGRSNGNGTGSSSGFFGRVLNTLEFWR